MEDEKEIGITKNHLGFIADEIMEAIPPEWENIVRVDDEGIKKLSYIKLSGILWGVCREQQTKIEHLETRLFEVENFIKDFVKPKPKTRTRTKTTEKINNIKQINIINLVPNFLCSSGVSVFSNVLSYVYMYMLLRNHIYDLLFF